MFHTFRCHCPSFLSFPTLFRSPPRILCPFRPLLFVGGVDTVSGRIVPGTTLRTKGPVVELRMSVQVLRPVRRLEGDRRRSQTPKFFYELVNPGTADVQTIRGGSGPFHLKENLQVWRMETHSPGPRRHLWNVFDGKSLNEEVDPLSWEDQPQRISSSYEERTVSFSVPPSGVDNPTGWTVTRRSNHVNPSSVFCSSKTGPNNIMCVVYTS